MAITTVIGDFAGGPDRLTTLSLNVATGQAPLTSGNTTVIPATADSGFHNRAMMINWTGDQTLDLKIQYDLGSSGNGLQTIAQIHFVAGNATAQTVMFFPTISAGAAAGTSLISGTQPTFAAAPAIANWEWLKAPADRFAIVATAGGTTTVGALTIDINESY